MSSIEKIRKYGLYKLFLESGKTQEQFCKENEISEAEFKEIQNIHNSTRAYLDCKLIFQTVG